MSTIYESFSNYIYYIYHVIDCMFNFLLLCKSTKYTNNIHFEYRKLSQIDEHFVIFYNRLPQISTCSFNFRITESGKNPKSLLDESFLMLNVIGLFVVGIDK